MSESAVWTKNDCKKRLAAQGKMSFIKSLDISVKRLKNCCFDINERILSIFWEVTFWSDFGGDTETGQFTQQCPKLHNTPRGNCLLPRLLSADWPSVQNLIKKVFFPSKSLRFTFCLAPSKARWRLYKDKSLSLTFDIKLSSEIWWIAKLLRLVYVM